MDQNTQTIHVTNCENCGSAISHTIDDAGELETKGHQLNCPPLSDLEVQRLKNLHKQVRESQKQPPAVQAAPATTAIGDIAGKIADQALAVAMQAGASQVIVMVGFGEGAINGIGVRWNGGPLPVRGLVEFGRQFIDKNLIQWDKK